MLVGSYSFTEDSKLIQGHGHCFYHPSMYTFMSDPDGKQFADGLCFERVVSDTSCPVQLLIECWSLDRRCNKLQLIVQLLHEFVPCRRFFLPFTRLRPRCKQCWIRVRNS